MSSTLLKKFIYWSVENKPAILILLGVLCVISFPFLPEIDNAVVQERRQGIVHRLIRTCFPYPLCIAQIGIILIAAGIAAALFNDNKEALNFIAEGLYQFIMLLSAAYDY